MRFGKLFIISAASILLVSCSPLETKTYGFGDTATVDKIEFTVNSASNTKKVGTDYLGDETTNNFVIVNLTVKNAGSSEIELLSGMMTYHVGESTYKAHSSGIYLDDGFYVVQPIGSGISKTINVVFETPSEYKETDYLLVKPSTHSSESEKIYMK